MERHGGAVAARAERGRVVRLGRAGGRDGRQRRRSLRRSVLARQPSERALRAHARGLGSTGCRPARAASRTSRWPATGRATASTAAASRRRSSRASRPLRASPALAHHPGRDPDWLRPRPLELPPYVEYGGRATTPPPFLSEGGRMRGSCSRAMRSGSPTSSTACSTFPRAARRTTARWARTCCCSWAASSGSPASPRRSTAGGRCGDHGLVLDPGDGRPRPRADVPGRAARARGALHLRRQPDVLSGRPRDLRLREDDGEVQPRGRRRRARDDGGVRRQLRPR